MKEDLIANELMPDGCQKELYRLSSDDKDLYDVDFMDTSGHIQSLRFETLQAAREHYESINEAYEI